ncbi:MAG: hypothetical protein COA42_10000 [Alteromonadaceae bacterium]|nr:MAG: hypothetical protein COA42_10000 [Alteromonadaceae bacterium]
MKPQQSSSSFVNSNHAVNSNVAVQMANSLIDENDNGRLSTDKLSTLLQSESQRSPVKVILNQWPRSGLHQQYLSTILGFDFAQKELLLDIQSPQPSVEVIAQLKERPFWIQIGAGTMYLMVAAKFSEQIHDLYCVKINTCYYTQNQRWHDRVEFDAHSGPEINIHVKNQASLSGWVRNLSLAGALIECYGKDVRNSFLRTSGINTNEPVAANIDFDDKFSMAIQVNVKQCNFYRKPCCHSKLRVIFDQQNTLNTARLESFLSSFH